MRTHFTLALTLLSVTGCQELGGQSTSSASGIQRSSVVGATELDVLKLSKRRLALESTVAIFESDYLAQLEAGDFAAGDEKDREAQFTLAAKANSPNALGLIGKLEQQLSLKDKRIVVLHNIKKTEGGAFQSTSFSIVNGRLFGTAALGLVGLELHFSTADEDRCVGPFRGCSVLPADDMRPHAFSNWESGGLGLPPQTRLDAESAALPQNQTGRTIELWSVPNPDIAKLLWPADDKQGFAGNRYACAGPLEEQVSAECDAASAGDPPPVPTSIETPLGNKVALISESDFQAGLLRGEFGDFKPDENTTLLAATIGTALNDASGRGVRSTLVRQAAIEADVLLVAKSPRFEKEVMSAERLFVVPGPIKLGLASGFVGLKPSILGLDPSFFSMGICGPVLFPGLGIEPGSPGIPSSLALQQAGYGSDRQVRGLPRATIRIPTIYQGRQTIQMLACSHFEPPRPPPPPVTPTFKQELCNGVDDNGNGRVDEGACFLNACSGCVPVADCGARRCVSAPDGCGGLIVCPCP